MRQIFHKRKLKCQTGHILDAKLYQPILTWLFSLVITYYGLATCKKTLPAEIDYFPNPKLAPMK